MSRRSQPRKSRPSPPTATRRAYSLTEIQNTEVKPIEPVFVDYKKDMSQFEARKGIDVFLYKKNESNDIFTLTYVFDTGTENDPALNLAFDYLGYLGSESLTAEQIASKMYGIACSFSMQRRPHLVPHLDYGTGREYGRSHGNRRGLLNKPKPDEAILANLKADMIQEPRRRQTQPEPLLRRPADLTCSTVPDFIRRTTLTNPALEAMSSEMLLAKIDELMDKQHEVLLLRPAVGEGGDRRWPCTTKRLRELQPLDKKHLQLLPTDKGADGPIRRQAALL